MRAVRTAKAKKGRQSLRRPLAVATASSFALGSNSAAAVTVATVVVAAAVPAAVAVPAAAVAAAAVVVELAAAVVCVVLRVAGDWALCGAMCFPSFVRLLC